MASVDDPARQLAAELAVARPGVSRRTLGLYLFCYLGLAPVLLLFLYLRVIPIVTTLFAGFYNWDMIRPIRVFVGLSNYVELLRDPNFQNALSNTAILAAGSVILGTVLALALAVTVNARVTGAPIYQLIYFLPVVTPWVPVTVVWKWIYDARFGPLNAALVALGLPPQAWLVEDTLALIAILIVMVWKTLGYNLIMFLVGLNNIPQEYYEAAVVDGAAGGKIFRYITLPLLRPMLLFVVVISTINAFNVFTPVFMMTSDIQGAAAKLVRTLVYDMWENGFRYFKVGYASAEAALLLLIVLMLTLMHMRLFREDR
ncbi:MAG: sugar ABC transporter permease [Armatimonadota bacterium]|nr:sugar ABC transporter permease [Armatimonadota bacterium]